MKKNPLCPLRPEVRRALPWRLWDEGRKITSLAITARVSRGWVPLSEMAVSDAVELRTYKAMTCEMTTKEFQAFKQGRRNATVAGKISLQ